MKIIHSKLAAGLAALGLLGASVAIAQQPAPSVGDAPAPQVAMANPSCSDSTSCTSNVSCCDEVEDGGCGSDDECSCYLFGPSDPWALTDPEKNCRGIKIGGWVQVGNYNKALQFFNYNTDPAFGSGNSGRTSLHQAWLYAEKATDGSDGLDIGYRADVVYGIDAQDTQAFGNPFGSYDFSGPFVHGIYGWAIPQVYAEFAYDKWKTKVGHFYTPMGYEVVGATGNFFYSHAYTNYNSEPFTHTGILSTYTHNDNLTLYTGWVLGWDTGFNQFNQGNAGINGFTYKISDDTALTYIFMLGNLGARNASPDNLSYNHSIVLTHNISEKLSYVFSSDMVASDGVKSPITGVAAPGVFNDQYSIVNYLFYKFSDCFAVGGRAEWYKTDGVSINDLTFGINYRPHANFVLRPEIRYEWSPGGLSAATAAAPTGTPIDTTIFGIDGVLSF